MSDFDPDSFLNQGTTESTDTQIIPCPVGEYPAVIESIKPRQANRRDGSGQITFLDITWDIDSVPVKEICQRDVVRVRQSIILDTTESGQMAWGKGKNVSLGRVREAVNQNQPGEAWEFKRLLGARAKVKVEHRQYEGNTMAEVSAVAKI